MASTPDREHDDHGDEHQHGHERPIGWWVKHVDRLQEESIDQALAGEGIGRRHWRVLNALAAGVDSLPGLDRALAPFAEPGPELTLVVHQLRSRGWVRGASGRLALTPTGAATREQLVRALAVRRERATAGIDPEAYQVTLDTLRQMARNLSA